MKNYYELDSDSAIRKLHSDVYDILIQPDDSVSIPECDAFIEDFLKVDYSYVLKISLCRITKPFKDKLKNREQLVNSLSADLNKSFAKSEIGDIMERLS